MRNYPNYPLFLAFGLLSILILVSPAFASTDLRSVPTSEIENASKLAHARLQVLADYRLLMHGKPPVRPLSQVPSRAKTLFPLLKEVRTASRVLQDLLLKNQDGHAVNGIDVGLCSEILSASALTLEEIYRHLIEAPRLQKNTKVALPERLRIELLLDIHGALLTHLNSESELGYSPLLKTSQACPYPQRRRYMELLNELDSSFRMEFVEAYGLHGADTLFGMPETAEAARLAEKLYQRELTLLVPKTFVTVMGQIYLFRLAGAALSVAGLSAKTAQILAGAGTGGVVSWHGLGALQGSLSRQKLSANHQSDLSKPQDLISNLRILMSSDKSRPLYVIQIQGTIREAYSKAMIQKIEVFRNEYTFIASGLQKYGTLDALIQHLEEKSREFQLELSTRSN